MKHRLLSAAIIGGLLMMVGLYLFPVYVGQELFIDWLGTTSGGGYWAGVELAMIFAALLVVGGVFLLRPGTLSIFRNPYYAAGAIVVVILAFWALDSLIKGAANALP
jgi:hypothetical protein